MFKKLTVLALLSTFIPSLFAGNVILAPGARANNYGGAFTAIADDGTAIYWNPAGLANQDENSEFNFSSYYIKSEATSSSAPIKIFDTPISAFKEKTLKTEAYLPFVSYSAPLEDCVIAFGAYAIGGGGGKWEDNGGITGYDYGRIEGEYGIMVFNISTAKKLSDKLAVGAGFDLLYMKANSIEQQKWTLGTSSVELKREHNSSGYSIGANIGAIYDINDDLNLGLTFRSGSKIKLEGDAELGVTLRSDSKIKLEAETDYDQDYQLPMSVSLGSAYRVTEKLTTSLQIDWHDYSAMKKDSNYRTELPMVFENENSAYYKRWNDIYVFAIGCEFMATDALSIFGGYKYEPSPYNKDMINIAETIQYAYDIYSVGAEYKMESGLSFGINILIVDSQTLADNQGTIYNYDSIVYRTTINYKF
ncbi:MAG: hypothetical protein GY817_05785 [bacterium]|nr:hypothetical protein [bacterium]